MLIDCELMGSERRIDLCVPDVERAWSFYCDIMGAQEVFRSNPGAGAPKRIGFKIGKTQFAIASQDEGQSDNSQHTLSLLAADLGGTFIAVVVYVRDPVIAAQRALDAGSRLQSEVASGTPTHKGRQVQVIIDPFGNHWAFAQL
jgi:uncharacterized glyoxalase superfamily protein PhnB